jgi:hypothetical protein
MMNIGIKLAVVLVCGGVAAACGGDDNNKTPSNPTAGAAGSSSNAGSKSDAGNSAMPMGGSSAGSVNMPNTAGNASAGSDAGMGGEGGSAPDPGEVPFVSKPTGLEVTFDDAAKAAGFTLVSSNFMQKPSGAQYYRQWFAELRNGTDKPQCFINLKADFQSAAGTSLQKLDTYTYGATFDIGSSVGLTATCAAPGEVVPIWSNALDANMVAVDQIKKLSITVMATEKPTAVVHASTPTLANFKQTFEQGLAWWTFSGDATATADIYNVQVEIWGKSGGVIVGKSAAFHSENFLKASLWQFKTLAGIDVVTLDTAKPYFDFIDGLDSALFVHYDPETAKFVAIKQAAADSWKAAEDRKAHAL